MGKSSFIKRKGGNVVNKKMLLNRMEDMAALMTAMEATLMEWEVWYKLLKFQKKNLSPEQYDFFVNDGPIFTDFPAKIMQSIREQMPLLEEAPEQPEQAPILGADGLPVTPEQPAKILGADGTPVV
jgi:hypothetical protein